MSVNPIIRSTFLLLLQPFDAAVVNGDTTNGECDPRERDLLHVNTECASAECGSDVDDARESSSDISKEEMVFSGGAWRGVVLKDLEEGAHFSYHL